MKPPQHIVDQKNELLNELRTYIKNLLNTKGEEFDELVKEAPHYNRVPSYCEDSGYFEWGDAIFDSIPIFGFTLHNKLSTRRVCPIEELPNKELVKKLNDFCEKNAKHFTVNL